MCLKMCKLSKISWSKNLSLVDKFQGHSWILCLSIWGVTMTFSLVNMQNLKISMLEPRNFKNPNVFVELVFSDP